MTESTSSTLADYERERNSLLQEIAAETARDGRFAAAWLTGSFGRGEQDAVSDLDLNLLTTDAGGELLTDLAVQGNTTSARRALFEQFGEPLIIHENPHNVPPGGSFSVVVYRSGHAVDWVLHPPGRALRPFASGLLFDHVGVPVQPPPAPMSGAALSLRLAERQEFFWMMACVTAKYWVRGDDVLVVVMLDQLQRIADEIARLLSGERAIFRSSSRFDLPRNRSQQADLVHQVCREVDALTATITERSGVAQPSGYPAVQTIIRLRADP